MHSVIDGIEYHLLMSPDEVRNTRGDSMDYTQDSLR